MPFLGIDHGKEVIYDFAPDRNECRANCKSKYNFIELPSGTIEKILGRNLKPKEMPVELKLENNGKF